ncbi:cytochrome p450, partial [Lasallia pustulata]
MRLSRIDPEKPVIYTDKATDKQYIIAPGTPMSMTGVLIHFDENIFPNPLAFKPERWLPSDPWSNDIVENRKKYLVPFTRGTRQCLGMNLARDVRMDGDRGYLELFEFDYERDLKIVGDGALPLYGVE